MPLKQLTREEQHKRQILPMADAHCHLDMVNPPDIIDAIHSGVLVMITDGVNMKSNRRALEISDGRHVYPALGIDPQHALLIEDDDLDDEINANIALIKANREKVVAIGEIGLDYKHAGTFELTAKQRTVFERFLDLALETKLPVSVHSRDAMDDILDILKEKNMEKVHMHFFEGNVQQAKEAERRGYMISIPPHESNKRKHVIKEVSLDNLLAESDAPAVGQTPKDVRTSIGIIAETKMLSVERTAGALLDNTRKFFNLHTKTGIMRI